MFWSVFDRITTAAVSAGDEEVGGREAGGGAAMLDQRAAEFCDTPSPPA